MLLMKQIVGSKFLHQERVIPQFCSPWGGQGGSCPACSIPAITALRTRDFVLIFFRFLITVFIIPQEIRSAQSEGIFFVSLFIYVFSLMNSTTSSKIKFPLWSNTLEFCWKQSIWSCFHLISSSLNDLPTHFRKAMPFMSHSTSSDYGSYSVCTLLEHFSPQI